MPFRLDSRILMQNQNNIAASIRNDEIIGKIIFFISWGYAILAFGFFLGLALGWIPAFFFAHIFDFLFTLVVTIITSNSKEN